MKQKPLLPGEELDLEHVFGEGDRGEAVCGLRRQFAPRCGKDSRRFTAEDQPAALEDRVIDRTEASLPWRESDPLDRSVMVSRSCLAMLAR